MGVTFENLDVRSSTSLQNNIGKILVPVDGSDASSDALEYAVRLAAKHNSEICLVHVVPTSVWNYCLMTEDLSPVLMCTMSEMEAQGERLLLSALTSVGESGLKVDARLDYGRAARKIVQIAEAEKFDLIVTGCRGLGFLGRLLFRSVSDEVVRRAPCPVLVVKSCPHEYEGGRE